MPEGQDRRPWQPLLTGADTVREHSDDDKLAFVRMLIDVAVANTSVLSGPSEYECSDQTFCVVPVSCHSKALFVIFVAKQRRESSAAIENHSTIKVRELLSCSQITDSNKM